LEDGGVVEVCPRDLERLCRRPFGDGDLDFGIGVGVGSAGKGGIRFFDE